MNRVKTVIVTNNNSKEFVNEFLKSQHGVTTIQDGQPLYKPWKKLLIDNNILGPHLIALCLKVQGIGECYISLSTGFPSEIIIRRNY